MGEPPHSYFPVGAVVDLALGLDIVQHIVVFVSLGLGHGGHLYPLLDFLLIDGAQGNALDHVGTDELTIPVPIELSGGHFCPAIHITRLYVCD